MLRYSHLKPAPSPRRAPPRSFGNLPFPTLATNGSRSGADAPVLENTHDSPFSTGRDPTSRDPPNPTSFFNPVESAMIDRSRRIVATQAARRWQVSHVGWHWADPRLLPIPNSWPTPVAKPVSSLRWATVHGHKGLQAETIALAVPRPPDFAVGNDGVAHWERGTEDESRRVLYAGASRAEKLLILVVDEFPELTVEHILPGRKCPLPFDRSRTECPSE